MTAEIPSTDSAYGRWESAVAGLAQHYGYASSGSTSCTAAAAPAPAPTQPTVQLSVTGTNTLQITTTFAQGSAPLSTLTVYDNSTVITTQAIDGSTTYSFSYTPSGDGDHVIKAVVTDSGGNSAQAQTTVSVSSTGSTGSGTTPPGGTSGGTTGGGAGALLEPRRHR
jgi:hypothetical protein